MVIWSETREASHEGVLFSRNDLRFDIYDETFCIAKYTRAAFFFFFGAQDFTKRSLQAAVA